MMSMYKLKRTFIAVLLLLSLTVAANAHPGKLDENGGHYDSKTGKYHYHKGPKAGQEITLASYPIKENSVYKAKIKRVVDGDTAIISFLTDDGTPYKDERLRFIGVNTPETVDPNRPVQHYGKEASNFTKKELKDKTFWLQTDVDVRDRYDRILGYIWLKEPKNLDSEKEVRAKMFNARLLLEGYAQAMTIQPNSRYSEMFIKFQREAKEASKGLWK